jgi:phosphoribosylformimino-5-aminoimidazole carboxamide ribonucleotide (ProFAR) isomerase
VGDRRENDVDRGDPTADRATGVIDDRTPVPGWAQDEEAELLALLPRLDPANLSTPVIRSIPRDG